MKFKISETLNTIKAYEAGKPLKELEREYNIEKAIKIASNENPIGFSAKVRQAVMDNLDEMNRYPESAGYDLCNKLAAKFNVTSQNIVLGNGSDDVISLLAHAFLNPGEEALMPKPSFLMYEISVKTAKGVAIAVPLKDFAMDLAAMAEKITPKTKMIFLTNPFNPTGSALTKKAFKAFVKKVPDNVLIILDEAYIEFVRDETIFNSLESGLQDPRVVTLRTFSKAYGLAGFRVGYGIMDTEVAEVLNRIRQPFNVNSLAQAAACAALDDALFLDQSIKTTHDGIDFLSQKLDEMGIAPLPTQANFIMLDVKTDATKVFKKLLEIGIITRSLKSYEFPTFLRINAGTSEENKVFIDGLKKVLRG
ncbi:MAG: histidinol-phosphate transaminase [Desulfobacteraceae bacterium]|nr:histidinol-phosphate transaminase [Desulfobacteraceae bacterium]